MKSISNLVLLLVLFIQFGYAQISVTHPLVIDVTNSNVFLDASKTFSLAAGATNDVGKGLVVPSVDLINFEFNSDFLSSTEAPSFYDGMIVYNRSTGTTLTEGNRSSTAVTVSPGFYYFSNPNGAINENVTDGTWKVLGAGVESEIKDISTTEMLLPFKISGAQVYAIKGSFTASGTSAAVTITKPTGMTGLNSITIYKNNTLFRREINSFNLSFTENNVITGYGLFTEIYPSGTYDYVLEYFK